MKIKNLIAAVTLPVITLGGCMSNDAFQMSVLDVKYERKAEIGTPKENIENVSERIYRRSQVYEDSTVPKETVETLASPFMKGYQNR